MTTKKTEAPGKAVPAAFGGPYKLARLLEVSPSTVWRWSVQRPKGTGGSIPSQWHAKLLKLARKQNIELQAADLVLT